MSKDEFLDASIADLSGISMDEVSEVEFGYTIPIGIYTFAIEKALIEVIVIDDIERKVANVYCTVVDVLELAKPQNDDGSEVDTDTILRAKQRETFWLDDMEGLGKLKKFFGLTGYAASGTLSDCLDGFAGHLFNAAIKNVPNKKDPDQIFARMNYKKIEPVEYEEQEA